MNQIESPELSTSSRISPHSVKSLLPHLPRLLSSQMIVCSDPQQHLLSDCGCAAVPRPRSAANASWRRGSCVPPFCHRQGLRTLPAWRLQLRFRKKSQRNRSRRFCTYSCSRSPAESATCLIGSVCVWVTLSPERYWLPRSPQPRHKPVIGPLI